MAAAPSATGAAVPRWAPALLLALSFVAFAPSMDAEFVSDDLNAIVANEWVVGPLDAGGIFTHLSWWGSARADALGYRPLTTLTLALNHRAGGSSVVGFHLFNLVLHGLVAWLVYLLAARLARNRAAAIPAAVAFVLLPIHSEAVVWVVGRAELLAATGYAAALLALVAHRNSDRAWLPALASVAFLGGLLSKENTLTLLAAPLLLAVLFPNPGQGASGQMGSGRAYRADLVGMAALLGGLAAYTALRLAAGAVPGAMAGDALDNPLAALALPTRLMAALSLLGRYLALLVWPHPLSVDYSFNALGIGPGFIGDRYSLVAVAAIALSVWLVRRYWDREPLVPFGLLLALSSYSIVANVVPIGTAMGERLFYLPSLGLCLAAGVVIADAEIRRPTATAAVCLALIVGWTAVDRHRSRQWRTPVQLFESAVRAVPTSARAHMELATAYGLAGRTVEALDGFERALAIKPDYGAVEFNKGNLLIRVGRQQDAIAAFRRALISLPDFHGAWHNMAVLYRQAGRVEEWAQAMQKAVDVAPWQRGRLIAFADELLAVGRDEQAQKNYDRAIEQEPTSALYFNRGVARHRIGGCSAAISDYLTAATYDRDVHPRVLSTAVACLQQLGRGDEASELQARLANLQSGR